MRSAPEAANPALADSPRRPRAELAVCLAAALLSSGLAWQGLRLAEADLSVPFFYTFDGLPMLGFAKCIRETGWYLTNPATGAPEAASFHDYPMSDAAHFAALKLLGGVLGGHVEAVNGYFLLGFPLAAASAAFALRRAGVAAAPAVALASLFSTLPGHFEQHLFIGAYWPTPFAALVALRLGKGERLWPPGGRGAAWAALAAAAFASTGVYYSAFAALLVAAGGAIGAIGFRTRGPALAAAWLIAALAAGGAANVATCVWHRWMHGSNPEAVQRQAWEAEAYGIRFWQLLMPVEGHRLEAFAAAPQRFGDNPFWRLSLGLGMVESRFAALGAVGAAGFVLLLAHAVFGRHRPGETFDVAARLALAGTLYAGAGGFAAILAQVGPWIRVPSRMAVYLAFFAFLGLGLALTRIRGAGRVRRVVWTLAVLALAPLGTFDQIAPRLVPNHRQLAATYRADADFVARVEAALQPGAKVFQLPYVPFPEGGAVGGMHGYDPLRGYLHSRALRWSFGAMKGRSAARWQAAVAAMPPSELLQELAKQDFAAIWVDRRGCRAEADAAWAAAALGAPIVDAAGQRAVYILKR